MLQKQVWEAHHALRMLAEFPIVPFRFKQPLIAAFFYRKLVCGRKRVLADMNAPAYSQADVKVHAIAMSKKLLKPFRKTIIRRRHGTFTEAPICARISEKHSFACLPGGVDARYKFSLARKSLRRVVDNGTRKATTEMAAHATPIDLPTDLSAYNQAPWRCLRDVVAQAHFKAEELRALTEGRAMNIDLAMSAFETCPFSWDCKDINHTTIFVIWTSSDEKVGGLEYHLKSLNLRRLCMKAGITKKKKQEEKKIRKVPVSRQTMPRKASGRVRV